MPVVAGFVVYILILVLCTGTGTNGTRFFPATWTLMSGKDRLDS
jgi:hypothetical protein